jgi:hypothetical protein
LEIPLENFQRNVQRDNVTVSYPTSRRRAFSYLNKDHHDDVFMPVPQLRQLELRVGRNSESASNRITVQFKNSGSTGVFAVAKLSLH